MVEDLREAFNFVLGVGVQCVLGWVVLVEEAGLGGLEHRGRVVGEGAVWLLDCGDGAVAVVRHGVIEVADGFIGEFMLRIPLVFFGRCAVVSACATVAGPPGCGLSAPCSDVCGGGCPGVSVWRRVANRCFACQRSWGMSPGAVVG